ncbi:MAG: hypothetical protein H0X34_19205 [Chthoniobacterales bacterium]|nr:hypothetical protein [Chthoniobacterales bacterium]
MILPWLPIPSQEWLSSFNDECREREVSSGERPFRALEKWAEESGQRASPFNLLLSHLSTPAFSAIYAFFKANTSVGRDEAAPFRQTCFFYDTAFWPVIVPVLYGEHVVDPIRFVVGMPASLFHDLGFDSAARDELNAHWFDCLHHMNNTLLLDGDQLPELAGGFLAGGEKGLFAAADCLLGLPPNQKAAELSRDAFESILKGFAVVKTDLTLDDAKEIRHKLHKLVMRCAAALPAFETARLDKACGLYPDIAARYEKTALPAKGLWQCYSEAQHAMAMSLRLISGELIS